MKKYLSILSLGLLSLVVPVITANAWHVAGCVTCPNGVEFKNVTILIAGTSCEGVYGNVVVTDKNGCYSNALPDCAGSYTVCIDTNTLPAGATLAGPVCVDFALSDTNTCATVNWEVGGPPCAGACWFTGGGAKIDQLVGIAVANIQGKGNGPQLSFGGNVYPGCSPTAGDGGDWNHVDRNRKLHFHGTSIQVVTCGNVVPPPPPGSTSPVTPFNYIEFTGTGTLKGIQGNKVDYGTVYFYARAEDRNEPGSKGANDGALIDRYYLRVYDGIGNTLLLVSGDLGDPLDISPVPITDGNFQLHVSSCDNPPVF